MRLDCGPCIVRSYAWDDRDALVKHANDRRVSINLRDRFPYPYTMVDAEKFLQHAIEARTEMSFAIEWNGEAVGGIGLIPGSDVERIGAELGYWLGPAAWGNGLATAAVRGVTAWAFETLGLHRVFAIPFLQNAASIRVLEKAGFRREGILLGSAVKEGKIIDQVVYARTVQDGMTGRTD